MQLLQATKDRISHKTTISCFLERVLKEQERSGLDDEHVAYLGGNLVRKISDQLICFGHRYPRQARASPLTSTSRWNPSHLDPDDVYDGYLLPKGTTLLQIHGLSIGTPLKMRDQTTSSHSFF